MQPASQLTNTEHLAKEAQRGEGVDINANVSDKNRSYFSFSFFKSSLDQYESEKN